MVKRKDVGDGWDRDELAVPLPIQLFLWRQCSPFIRPKLGKLHEATCTFCQSGPSHHEIKEASKSLEKVLVQNILFGLSPALTDAIRSVPRWRFVQAAFPHVMHCAATLLYNRREGTTNLGPAETKLLYTLHWIMLDAAEECSDSENDKDTIRSSPFYYLFSVTSIQVFIYLFAPLLLALKESDFQNFRLENGLKIWGALWDYRHPDVAVFTTPVRPKRTVLRAKRLQRSMTKFGDVFLGVGKGSPEDDSVFFLGSGSSSVGPSQSRPYGPTYSECSNSTTDSKCLEAAKFEEELRSVAGPRDSFPETIPEETSSTEEEHVVIFRLGSYTENDNFRDSQVYKAEHPTVLLRPPLLEVRDTTGALSSPMQSMSQPPSGSISSPTDSQSARPGGTISPYKSSSIGSEGRSSPLQDPILATILDVSVIRCLFVHQWTEEGVYWALMFIYRRMQEIGHEVSLKETPRRRSNSLPVPKIQVSFHSDDVQDRTKEYTEDSEHSSSDVNYTAESSYLIDAPKRQRESGSTKKKKKISDLKAFVETKLWSRSEKALEKIGREDSRRSSISEDQVREDRGRIWRVDRPHSAMEKSEDPTDTVPPSQNSSVQGLIKGKSMPSLSSLHDEISFLGFVGENDTGLNITDAGANAEKGVVKMKRPIITVTQYTPSPSETCRDQVSQNSSIEKHCMMYYSSTEKQQYSIPDMGKLPNKPPLSRSQTDSNIQYPCHELPEIPGTSHFVTKDGFINLKVLLKAANSIANREFHICSLRVCETILRLLDFLLDMGILKMNIKMNKISHDLKQDREKMVDSDCDSKHDDPVQYFINTLLRITIHLGCPHGCNEGLKGPQADFLRHTIQTIFSRIYRCDQNGFKKYLREFVGKSSLRKILDFFHAFVGFCVDPSSLLSPMSDWFSRLQDGKRPGTGRIIEGQQGGYATNFGSSLGGAGTRGIEGQLVANTFKSLVTRFSKCHSQLKNIDNMGMYSDVRQLMCYVKEAHGGVFRRVSLSGLIDSSDRPHKKVPTTQTRRIVRRVPLSDAMRDSPTSHRESFDGGKSKKGLFKKKATSSSITSAIRKAPSMSSVYDDQQDDSSHGQSPASTIRRRHHPMFPGRPAENVYSGSAHLGKRRIKKLVDWIKKTTSSEETAGLSSLFGNEAIADLQPTLARKFSQHHTRPKFATKPGARPMTQKFQIAKKKVEDKLGKITFAKKQKDTSSDDTPDLSRRNSEDLEGSPREANVVLLRERKLINCDSVKSGMVRFSFLMETCQPGSVPDSQLAGAVLDLPGSPVIARAALLLEMSHYVHRCNSGSWPSWMKSSLPFYRGGGPASRNATGARRMPALQRVAGKMFYAWAESISIRLEELFDEIGPSVEEINMSIDDPDIKKALRTKDEEEDFLDELNVNPGGDDCPLALRMIAVQLLLEITSFLRETFPTLPKSGRMSVRERTHIWPGQGNLGVGRDPHLRRWSTTLSSMGPPHASAQSLHSYGDSQPSGDRKISFALHEADNESVASSNTTLTSMQTGDDERKRHSQGRGHFLKKGGSFKRKSYKIKRGQKDPDNDSIKRSDSIRSRRKVSAVSERSDTSEHMEHDISGEESPGVLSNEDFAESPADVEVADDYLMNNFPWLKIVVRLFMAFNQKCTHQTFCHPLCYRRQMRACKRLTHAARKVYGEDFEEEEHSIYKLADFESSHKKDKKQSRKTSDQAHGSPIKRKDSFLKKEKVDKTVDIASVISKLAHHQQGSVMHLSKDTINTNGAEEEKINNKETTNKKTKREEQHPMINYLKRTVMGLFHAQFSLIIKSIIIIPDELLIEILPVVWEMLLEHDNELVATVAVIFILSGVKLSTMATNLINSQLTHPNPSIRLNAILRFQILWRSRYQAWPRMEEGAHMTFKVPPHGIEFTLPSPKIGVESIPVVDPPWMPQVKTNVEEFTLDQIHNRSFLTANRTRRKIHAEMVKAALEAEESKRRIERENFYLSAVPTTIQAAYEPSLHHAVADDHEEVDDIEIDTTSRQMTHHHMCVAQQLFPSCLCAAVLTIIHLLDDPAVTADGVAVYQTAEQVIWSCLVEDSALFLRYFLEKLTREKQDVVTRLLRRLIRFIPRLPSQAAFALFNYLVGYVMFYTRSPHEGAQEHTAAALSILWMAVPSVHGIMFKDLKQIFRKEQCDAALLLTANVPSAKKIIVHGPGGADAGGIPCQFPIQEDTQFSQIHTEAGDFFGLSEEEVKYYYLVDHKTNQIHNMQSHVRDFYFFKRSQYPELLMVKMETEKAFEALQLQAFMQKFLEIGKVLMTLAVLKRPDQVAQRVFFLHEELTKLPSFPRKALEADFSLYKGGTLNKEVRGIDQLHKYTWVLLVARMFEGMASNVTYNNDLRLFISVINGALILHCEDSSMLRLCMATYVNAAIEFKSLFSTNGYMLIMPTILRVYSNYHSNKMVCKTIESVVKQLYIIHRKPFILQMLGSVAPLLDTDDTALYGDANKIRGSRLFDLLHSLDKHQEDHLHVLDLVPMRKPLRPIDFCYHDESDNLSLLEVMDMCITVTAYAADSRRGHQMLAILEAVLAKTLHLMQKTTKRDLRQEKETIHHVAGAIRTLVLNSEPLAKSYNGPQISGFGVNDGWGSNRGPYTKGTRSINQPVDPDDDSHSKFVSDGKRPPNNYQGDIEDPELLRQQFRQPRAMLLNIVAEFLTTCTTRLNEISKKTGQDTRPMDLLDTKCHLRLTEVAHSLLKMAPYDPTTMGCVGLQRYMNDILPQPDWSHEDLRPALVNILRRLEKMFNKLFKKATVRRITDWVAASNLLKGVYTTLCRHPYIAHLPHLKMLVQVCQSLVLGERLYETEAAYTSDVTQWSNSPPQDFCSVVVRIIAAQILALGGNHSLEQVCGGSPLLPSPEKTENLVVNLLLPLFLRVGCASKDSPRMRQSDISFAVMVILHAMNPYYAKLIHTNTNIPLKSAQQARSGQPARLGQGSDPRSQSWSHYQSDSKHPLKVQPGLLRISFLGLKVMVVCFEKQLSKDWHRIMHCIRDMDKRNEGGIPLWDFLHFCVVYKTPLFLHIKPFIMKKLINPSSNEKIKQFQLALKARLKISSESTSVCKGVLIRTFGHQLKTIKEDMINAKIGQREIRPSTFEIQTEVSLSTKKPKISISESKAYSPTKRKESEQSSLHPRLFRRPSILRKRHSSSNIFARPAFKEDSSTSGPTSVDGTEPTISEEGSSTGEKHRLHRKMAQSRKTFRFRKSRYGQNEDLASSPTPSSDKCSPTFDISHIGTTSPSTIVEIEPQPYRDLHVTLIPEEEISSTYRSTVSSPSDRSYAVSIDKIPIDSSFLDSTNKKYLQDISKLESGLKELDNMELKVRGFNQHHSESMYRDAPSRDMHSVSSYEETISYRSSGDSQYPSRKNSASNRKGERVSYPIKSIINSPEELQSIYEPIPGKQSQEKLQYPYYSKITIEKDSQKVISMQSEGTRLKNEQQKLKSSFRHSWAYGEIGDVNRVTEIPAERSSKVRKTGIVQSQLPGRPILDISDQSQIKCAERAFSSNESTSKFKRTSYSSSDDAGDEFLPTILTAPGLPPGTKRFVVDKFTVTFAEKDEDTLI